jgi:hypothetical protein
MWINSGLMKITMIARIITQFTHQVRCLAQDGLLKNSALLVIMERVQVNNYEIVVIIFHISRNFHDIQQLSINLAEFTQFVQLMN